MPNLHELFDAATGDLPPLPDLAPSARKIVRRRQFAARTTAAMLSSALVIGAGTFALAAHHPGNAHDAASGPPHAYNQQYVLDTLRSLWPNKNQRLAPELGASAVIVVSQNGKQIGILSFEVMADVAEFPEELGCLGYAQGCLKATTSDGDRVLAETISAGQAVTVPPTASKSAPPYHQLPTGGSSAIHQGSNSNAPASASSALGITRGYRLHGTYFGQLSTYTNYSDGRTLTDQQMLSIVESPAYEQLIESAVAASSLGWFGTPPAGIPSDTTIYGPSPSTSPVETPPTGTNPSSIPTASAPTN